VDPSVFRVKEMSKSKMSNSSKPGNESSYKRYALVSILAILFWIGLSFGLTQWTEYQHLETLDLQGNERLELYASTVQSAKQRFDYLPYIASRNQQVKALLNGLIKGDQVSHRLGSWQAESGAAALYLMDRDGLVLASSNWQDEESFVGNNYHFRPYFRDAISGGKGLFFAVGVSTGKPGLFLSRAVWDNNQVIGAAVVKIDMTQLEKDWALGGEEVLIVDADGVIFLSSNSKWKYRSLKTVSPETLTRIKQARKYSGRTITPLDLLEQKTSPQGHHIIKVAKPTGDVLSQQRYLMHHRLLKDLNWTLYYLTDLKGLVYKKRSALLIAGLITLLLSLTGFIFINRTQSRRLLEVRVAKRTEALNRSNNKLLEEIDSRIKTEDELRKTHEELIQAEKLAVLGHMSAGIVHEINQPLSAMQTFVASTKILLERNDQNGARENLEDISSMVRRVTAIVSHLKGFAGKAQGLTSPIDIIQTIESALLILAPRLESQDLKLIIEKPNTPVFAIADKLKLEQILVNLVRNALDAMQHPMEELQHQLKIWTEVEETMTHIFIADTGSGITPDDLPKVFDPFFTTKPQGEGLGLGLSVSCGIAKEFGGDLKVIERPEKGTLFRLSLSNNKQGNS